MNAVERQRRDAQALRMLAEGRRPEFVASKLGLSLSQLRRRTAATLRAAEGRRPALAMA
jgi:hypothetical protein